MLADSKGNDKRRCYNCLNCLVKIPVTKDGLIQYRRGVVFCDMARWLDGLGRPIRTLKFTTGYLGSGDCLGEGKRKNLVILQMAEECDDYEEARGD